MIPAQEIIEVTVLSAAVGPRDRAQSPGHLLNTPNYWPNKSQL